jgi:very-short-patch-repair endonuclease
MANLMTTTSESGGGDQCWATFPWLHDGNVDRRNRPSTFPDVVVVDQGVREHLTRLARRQNGAVSWAQLYALGVTEGEARHRVATGIWHRLHRGVYCLGDPQLIPLVAESAALLAVGEGSLLSHHSAGAVWEICARPRDRVSVTLVGRCVRARDGLSVRCLETLERDDISARRGLRLTAPARTIIDLAATLTASQLDPLLDAVLSRRLADEDAIRHALERVPDNHAGAATVRACLGQTGLTRSQAERRLRSLLKAAELPQPVANERIVGLMVDFCWPEAKLILEVDGFRFHGGRAAFERDRRRDQRLAAAGFQVIRITWRQLEEEPMAVLARLAQALALRAA